MKKQSHIHYKDLISAVAFVYFIGFVINSYCMGIRGFTSQGAISYQYLSLGIFYILFLSLSLLVVYSSFYLRYRPVKEEDLSRIAFRIDEGITFLSIFVGIVIALIVDLASGDGISELPQFIEVDVNYTYLAVWLIISICIGIVLTARGIYQVNSNKSFFFIFIRNLLPTLIFTLPFYALSIPDTVLNLYLAGTIAVLVSSFGIVLLIVGPFNVEPSREACMTFKSYKDHFQDYIRREMSLPNLVYILMIISAILITVIMFIQFIFPNIPSYYGGGKGQIVRSINKEKVVDTYLIGENNEYFFVIVDEGKESVAKQIRKDSVEEIVFE